MSGEVDEYWEKLSASGKEVQCGWLKDKYGVSWQIVPTILSKLLQHPDPEKSKRVMHAMLQMLRLNIKRLQDAYERECSANSDFPVIDAAENSSYTSG